jgi:hypothetical protein
MVLHHKMDLREHSGMLRYSPLVRSCLYTYIWLTVSSDEPRNFSRNAALAGAGAAAGAGGAYAATRHNDNIDDSTHTDRSFPLSGGVIAPHSDKRPASSTYSQDASVPASTAGRTGVITGLNTGTAGGTGAASGEAALANLGLERHSAIDHSGHSHEFHGDPCETEPAEKTLPFIPGPRYCCGKHVGSSCSWRVPYR